MATITASMVNELRNKTGQGMMECKRALTEVGGDVEKAVEYFRKKGVKTSITERQASEGRVAVSLAPDNSRGAIAEVLCNTDFTAKSDVVAKLLNDAACRAAANPNTDVKNDPAIRDAVTSISQQTGENVQLNRVVALSAPAGGKVGGFHYTVTGKIGVLVALTGNPSDDVVRNLCLHIVANKPLAMTREQIPTDVIAKERDIAVEQAKATGKPQQIAEKIAEGKLNSFFAERALLDQEFVRPDVFKGTVAAYLKQNGATLVQYERVEVGQG